VVDSVEIEIENIITSSSLDLSGRGVVDSVEIEITGDDPACICHAQVEEVWWTLSRLKF